MTYEKRENVVYQSKRVVDKLLELDIPCPICSASGENTHEDDCPIGALIEAVRLYRI